MSGSAGRCPERPGNGILTSPGEMAPLAGFGIAERGGKDLLQRGRGKIVVSEHRPAARALAMPI